MSGWGYVELLLLVIVVRWVCVVVAQCRAPWVGGAVAWGGSMVAVR